MEQLPSLLTILYVGIGFAVFTSLGIWFGDCVTLFI